MGVCADQESSLRFRLAPAGTLPSAMGGGPSGKAKVSADRLTSHIPPHRSRRTSRRHIVPGSMQPGAGRYMAYRASVAVKQMFSGAQPEGSDLACPVVA